MLLEVIVGGVVSWQAPLQERLGRSGDCAYCWETEVQSQVMNKGNKKIEKAQPSSAPPTSRSPAFATGVRGTMTSEASRDSDHTSTASISGSSTQPIVADERHDTTREASSGGDTEDVLRTIVDDSRINSGYVSASDDRGTNDRSDDGRAGAWASTNSDESCTDESDDSSTDDSDTDSTDTGSTGSTDSMDSTDSTDGTEGAIPSSPRSNSSHSTSSTERQRYSQLTTSLWGGEIFRGSEPDEDASFDGIGDAEEGAAGVGDIDQVEDLLAQPISPQRPRYARQRQSASLATADCSLDTKGHCSKNISICVVGVRSFKAHYHASTAAQRPVEGKFAEPVVHVPRWKQQMAHRRYAGHASVRDRAVSDGHQFGTSPLKRVC